MPWAYLSAVECAGKRIGRGSIQPTPPNWEGITCLITKQPSKAPPPDDQRPLLGSRSLQLDRFDGANKPQNSQNLQRSIEISRYCIGPPC